MTIVFVFYNTKLKTLHFIFLKILFFFCVLDMVFYLIAYKRGCLKDMCTMKTLLCKNFLYETLLKGLLTFIKTKYLYFSHIKN